MKKIANPLNCLVFILATLTIVGFVYQGFALERFFVVTVMIVITDGSFILSTIVNLINYRKEKILRIFSFISLFIITVAIVMKVVGIEYPPLALTFWWFYIWVYYGVVTVKVLSFTPIR